MRKKLRKIISKAGETLGFHKDKGEIKTIAVCAAQVPFFSGGAETHVNSLILHLREKGFEVELINIPYKWYPHEQLLKSIEVWKLLDLSESNGKKIDLVIATKFPSYFINHPNKVLWLIHQYRQIYDLFDTPYSGSNQKSRKDMALRERLIKMDNQAFKSYKRIYTNAKNTARRLKKYNAVSSLPLYHPPKLAGRYYSSDNKDYILSVGRLDKLKRVDLLLNALKHCDNQVKCKIAGTGPEQENLRALAHQLGISNRVEFLGFVSDEQLLRLYAETAVVFFAPLDEDYGYIILESFLAKKPVITGFDSGGPLEFVEDGQNGIILQSCEPENIARQIEGLFFDKEKCAAFGAAGYNKVKDINWDFVIDCLLYGNI
ncbi:MAG: glycosyltransferase family 4 protein [candidate division Zixibacteria bacterium]|nr:glycosyltransferase family 4 protein [candidate division Zixibacteria bacterium]